LDQEVIHRFKPENIHSVQINHHTQH